MRNRIYPPVIVLLCALLACNIPGSGGDAVQPVATNLPTVIDQPTVEAEATATFAPSPTATFSVVHVLTPSSTAKSGTPIFDVESSLTAPEKRAPYGDSYDINRLERPFLQDMTYVPDLDIETFSLGSDNDFYYVSMDLIGADPNNPLGIQYGAEFDVNADGFGDYIVVARSPFSTDWTNTSVQVYTDEDHDVSALSAEKSDAPITTNGYEKLVFDGSVGTNTDPDLAWVRINFSDDANVQFSVKKSLIGSSFMYGVIADAGLKDVGKLDYVDRFKEIEAGSPIKDKKYYPLKTLFAVDNTCREIFGFRPNGYEPMLCPRDQPNPTKKPTDIPSPTPAYCLSIGTRIDTPNGPINVENLRSGDIVWTVNASGERIAAPLLKVSHTPVLFGHQVVHIVLNDGRELWVSPKHPTADGRLLGELKPGDLLDGASVTSADLVPYTRSATYDLLPAGDTGFYWANGILIDSTLADQQTALTLYSA